MKVKIARIGKPHGIRGEVTAQLFTDNPQARFAHGEVIETNSDEMPKLTVKGHRWNKDRILISFAEINDRNTAEELRNTILYAEPEKIPEEDEAWYPHEIEGLKVIREGNVIGEVTKLEAREIQDILTIKLNSGEERLVPFVEEIVPEINLDEGALYVTPPGGLLDED
ncbi:MAG: ribosome maturation factor RimM [Micrococcaceae bacterium]